MSNPWQIQTVQYDKTNSEGNTDTTGYGQISILLSKYVLKEKGKGLSTNDFSDSDVQKLNSVEVGSQVNKLETLTVNRNQTLYPDADKNININIPTKTSQLENDGGYAKLLSASSFTDYSDSYVGKSKVSFQDEENLAIGKGANADKGGVALGAYTTTSETYDVNINNELRHNTSTNYWEGKITQSVSSDKATSNVNGTNLNQLDTVINDLQTETTNRINVDDSLQNSINSITTRVTSIEDKIPNQASSENQLADKSFVNSSIQTNTANFRGNWDTWADVPSNSEDYPQDYSGSTTPTVNDYLVVQNASDYTSETLSGSWRFKYTGNWETDGKNGWIAEYQVNEEPFTSEQLFAINSGITSEKVAQYDEFINSGSGDVTGVKGEAETTYRTGDVNITKANLGLTDDEMGMVWHNSNITSHAYNSPYYVNGIWVIGGSAGIKYSIDGKTWSDSNITSGDYNSPYYANGIWVIGGGGTGIKYSIDGKTWSDSNITSGSFYTPYYANGIWVIGSDFDSTGSDGIKYSIDGKTWSDSNITSGAYNSPYYVNGIWVIGGSAGIKYSIDGKTWSDSNITSGAYNSPYYANGIWVIGSDFDSTGSAGIKYSIDGKIWSDSNITSGSFYTPYYANGIWVICSDFGSAGSDGIKYSIDGKTWYNSNITSGVYNSPYYVNGIWVIGGSAGIKYSTFNSLNDLGSAFKGITELSEKTTNLIEKTTNLIEKTSSATLYYGICSTSRNTNAKVVTCPTFELEIGCKIIVKFTDTNGSAPSSGNISLDINGTGAINLYNKNYAQMTYRYSGEFRGNRLCEITYDGTYYIWLNYDSNTTYSTITQAEITAGTSTSSRLVTPKLLADNYNKKSSITNHTLYL